MSPSRSLIHLSSSPSSNPKFAVNSFEIFLVFRRYIRFLRAGFVTPLSRGPPLGSDRAPGRQRTPRGRRNHTGNSIRRSMKCGAEDYAATFLNPLAPVISSTLTLEGVRRALEKYLGMNTFFIGVHKRLFGGGG
ncbi:uncharacterized protein LOC122022457 isoform X2 [Zingiber officinale]|uniref:uncharacterized protein LOC122022457 isoform X2 n=1 Tax=Zingiber officinale TaxID=94328 RepID=UPI001C4B8D5F|nr:uncharacterized protein LOC122022457 isoform X2 [Zingiber officinale]